MGDIFDDFFSAIDEAMDAAEVVTSVNVRMRWAMRTITRTGKDGETKYLYEVFLQNPRTSEQVPDSSTLFTHDATLAAKVCDALNV